MPISKLQRAYLVLWFLGALISFVLQFFFPAVLSEQTVWGLTPGWQREIAFWNLGMAFILALTIFKKTKSLVFAVTLTATLLSLLFAINHLDALLTHSERLIHWIAFAANSIAFLFGIVVLTLKSTTPD